MYRLIKGDSELKLKEIESTSVDAIITDPRYQNHELDIEFNEDDVFKEFHRVLKEEGMLVLFGRGVSLSRWVVKLDELGFKFLEEVVWSKSTGESQTDNIHRKHEMMVIFTKGSGKINKIRIDPTGIPHEQLRWDNVSKNINTLKNSIKDDYTLKVINHYNESGELTYDFKSGRDVGTGITGHNSTYTRTNRYLAVFMTVIEGYVASTVLEVGYNKNENHTSEKPVRLMEVLVELLTKEDDVILDPFMGIGTTGVASLNLGRQFIGIESDGEYFNEAQQRLKESTNKVNK